MALNKQVNFIDGQDLAEMFLGGAYQLGINAEQVNRLNVFPVPDGDTGTNMNLTLASGIEELQKKSTTHIGEVAKAISKGLLMGARGNSGVILSQLFRGFATSIQNYEKIDSAQFAVALQLGVEIAYKAVGQPVEGTILTVSREAAQHALRLNHLSNMVDLMEEVITKAKQAVMNTPDQLPILKQVGVVDAGGQGLLYIYEGFLLALNGEFNKDHISSENSYVMLDSVKNIDAHTMIEPAQLHLSTGDIKYGYCTEFLVNLRSSYRQTQPFNEVLLKEQLHTLGDSTVIVSDDEWAKIHIHAEYPGEVMNIAMQYGDLSRIKIENMREQHSEILQQAIPKSNMDSTILNQKSFGFVVVSSGEGNESIFKSLGADVVISGGQSMNPSTEQIVHAIQEIHAETVYILPNNSNVLLASKQAKELIENKKVIVIPTKTITQGMTAIIAFQEDLDEFQNEQSMNKAIARVKSGQVTTAVRHSNLENLEIKQGSYIGILEGKIVITDDELLEVCKKMVDCMVDDDASLITVLTGDGASQELTQLLRQFLEETHSQLEIEIQEGGQPLYPYLFGLE
jgi:DAK2 domain fusion protein YloV